MILKYLDIYTRGENFDENRKLKQELTFKIIQSEKVILESLISQINTKMKKIATKLKPKKTRF